MMQEKGRRDARAAEERERLSIHSVDELKGILSEIDGEIISTAKKAQKKCTLLREQINIRKKVFQESINIPFTTKGKLKGNEDPYQLLLVNSQPICSVMEQY